MTRGIVSPLGAFDSSKLRIKERATWASETLRPRALSTITSTSFMNCSMSKNADTGAQSPVFLLRAKSAAAPQFG